MVTTGRDFRFLKTNHIDETEINYLSCLLTSYFEDIISGSNIWLSFIKAHKRLYGKQLPFFYLEEYIEGEVNQQDVHFLIWYFFNSIQDKTFFYPSNQFFFDIAEEVFYLFDEAWEDAPENGDLTSFHQLSKTETNFYHVKSVIETLFFKTYLFFPDSTLTLIKMNDEILSIHKNDENLPFILKDNNDSIVNRYHTRLLALKGKEWIAEIIGENHPLYDDILAISPKIQGFFLYKGQDKTDIFIEHIASGKQFTLTKKSYDHPDDLKEKDTILYIGIVKWRGEWWFSSALFQCDYDDKLVSREKNSMKGISPVDFLDHQTRDINAILKKHEMAFLNFNQGSPIAFMPAGEADMFVRKFVDYYNHFQSDSVRNTEENDVGSGSIKKLMSIDDHSSGYSKGFDTALVFFNPKRGCEIVFDVNSLLSLCRTIPISTRNYRMHIL